MVDRLCPYCENVITIEIAGIAPSFRFQECQNCGKTYRLVDEPKSETVLISEQEFRNRYNQGNLIWNGSCWQLGNIERIELKIGDVIEILNSDGHWNKRTIDKDFQSIWHTVPGQVMTTTITARK